MNFWPKEHYLALRHYCIKRKCVNVNKRGQCPAVARQRRGPPSHKASEGRRGVRIVDLKKISKWIVVIGAANWGLIGLFNFNLVTFLLGSWPILVTVVYVLVGAAGFWAVYNKLTKPSKK